MSKRNNILSFIKTNMKTIIQVTHGYNVEVREIKRGIYNFEDVINKPCICFWCMSEDSTQYANRDDCILNIYFYGYSSNLDEIHDLADDVKYYLFNDYDDDNVEAISIGKTTIFEGGVHAPQHMFEIITQISYQKITTQH